MMRKSLLGFDAKSDQGCESGTDGAVTESEALCKGDEPESEVDFEIDEGGGGEKKDMVVEAIDRGVKVIVEKQDCLMLRVMGLNGKGEGGWHQWRGQSCCGEVGYQHFSRS